MPLIDIGGIKIDPVKQLLALDRADYEESLYLFFRAAWSQGLDGAPWKDGWAVEAVAEHLQAVCDGDIKRLAINIPPRCSKSNLCSVAFPAWVWAQQNKGPTSGPSVKFLSTSYANQLSLRDSVKGRRLIESPWYQRHWGDRFALNSDQNTKSRFSNDKGGERLIASIGATTTGEGGDIILIDDANSASESASAQIIQSTNDWWDQTMSSRLNDAKTGAFIVIQQRLAEDDLTGHILENDMDKDWVHLCLPMRFEKSRSFMTPIGWTDPRTEEGQLLWPERFGEKEVKALERAMGPWGSSGQLQQRPEPQGGGIIKREWWETWTEEAFPPMDYIIASLDTAYTTKEENDPSAMTIWGVFTSQTTATPTRVVGPDGRPISSEQRAYADGAPKVMLMHAWQDRLELHDLVARVAKTCKQLKVDTLIIEAKASGLSVAQEIRRLYGNESFGVQLSDPKSMDKMARLYSVQHLFAEGMIYAPDRTWADMVITQVAMFPKGKRDDLCDTVSMSLRYLRDTGLMQRAPERIAEMESLKVYPGGQDMPLYPA